MQFGSGLEYFLTDTTTISETEKLLTESVKKKLLNSITETYHERKCVPGYRLMSATLKNKGDQDQSDYCFHYSINFEPGLSLRGLQDFAGNYILTKRLLIMLAALLLTIPNKQAYLYN